MARRKATPDRSSIVREPTLAWSRRQRDDGDEPEAKQEPKDGALKDTAATGDDSAPVEAKASPPKKVDVKDETAPQPVRALAPKPTETAPYGHDDLDPEAVPTIPRSHTETVLMPMGTMGKPPEMPTSVAPPVLALGTIEDPTHMPGPKDIPGGEPTDRAPAPGFVPRGDSRSLRREGDFALIYRLATYVISRFGAVGQRGQWRVVEYPTSSAAAHSYAKECSRFVSEGFSDYRG